MELVFSQLKSFNLKMMPKKSYFFQASVIFLGQVLSADRISANPEKVEKVRDWPVPSNANELHSFLRLGILLLLVHTKFCMHSQVSTPVSRSDQCQEDKR